MNITVFARPNSKNPRIEKDLFNNLHIYVKEPPLEGKANSAIREALAKHFKIPKSSVQLVRGGNSKIKVFRIIQ